MKQISFLLPVLLIASGFLGCASWQSYQAEEGLHQTYIDQAKKMVGQAEDKEQYQISASPVVIFENLDRYKLYVTVSSTRGREPIVWKFTLEPNQVKVFDGQSAGPAFRYREVYQVEAFRECGGRPHYGSFRVRVRPSYDEELEYYNGGYQFRPRSYY